MPIRYVIELITLAALWGASFLFMRIAAPEFGPILLIEIRLAIAAAFLLPLLYVRKGFSQLRTNAKPLALLGIFNSALPFTLFAFATLTLSAGLTSVAH